MLCEGKSNITIYARTFGYQFGGDKPIDRSSGKIKEQKQNEKHLDSEYDSDEDVDNNQS